MRAFRQYPICHGLTRKKGVVAPVRYKHTQSPSQPWQMLTKMAPKHPKWGLKPRNEALSGWTTTPWASGYNLGGSEGMNDLQSASMFWRWCIAATLECFEGHTPPQLSKNYMHLLRGSSPIERYDNSAGRKASCGAQEGHFCQRQPCLVVVKMVVVGQWRLVTSYCFNFYVVSIQSWHLIGN